jgi:tRNA U34 5-methylaminomethyl-2-thiouridine-forming methyltransferase MnmC
MAALHDSPMSPEIVRTDDGSDTLYQRELNQHYHSTFGAVQESRHIFIETGFLHVIDTLGTAINLNKTCLRILEIGFGTGLNALLTLAEAEKLGIKVHYSTLEAFPLKEDSWKQLNYPHLFGSIDVTAIFAKLHLAAWNKDEVITPHFTLHKIHGNLETFCPAGVYQLIYFDAFGPDAQPELWTEQIFFKLANALTSRGIFVTYSVKGSVVRALRAAGLQTEKLAGPPGKRHILRASKL